MNSKPQGQGKCLPKYPETANPFSSLTRAAMTGVSIFASTALHYPADQGRSRHGETSPIRGRRARASSPHLNRNNKSARAQLPVFRFLFSAFPISIFVGGAGAGK